MKPIDRYIDWLSVRGYTKEAEDAARYMTTAGVRSNAYENLKALLFAWEFDEDIGLSVDHVAAHFLERHWWHQRQAQRYESLAVTMRSSADDVAQVMALVKQVEQLEIRSAALADELKAEKAAACSVDAKLEAQRKRYEHKLGELKKTMPRATVVEYAKTHEPFRNNLQGAVRHAAQKAIDDVLEEYIGGQIVERTSNDTTKINPLAP